jgi:hypothetical protein
MHIAGSRRPNFKSGMHNSRYICDVLYFKHHAVHYVYFSQMQEVNVHKHSGHAMGWKNYYSSCEVNPLTPNDIKMSRSEPFKH